MRESIGGGAVEGKFTLRDELNEELGGWVGGWGETGFMQMSSPPPTPKSVSGDWAACSSEAGEKGGEIRGCVRS